jgi:hypothetical protein
MDDQLLIEPDATLPQVVDKLEIPVADEHPRKYMLRFPLSSILWILWKLPCMYSADLGRLGPGFGMGAGFGFGFGFGLIGGQFGRS